MKLKHILPIVWLVAGMGMNQGMQAQTGFTKKELAERAMENNYYPNGQIKSTWEIGESGRIWERVRYYENWGIIFAWAFGPNQEKEWHWIFYYENGCTELEWSYKNGKKDGLRIAYHENWTIATEWNYNKGKEHGVFADYYPNGQIKSIWQYIQWFEDWNFYWYDTEGNVVYNVFYNNTKYFKDSRP